MPRLKPRRGERVLGAIHPNRGVEVAYRRRMERLIEEMNRSLLYWIRACYRANEPEMAQDESPAMTLRAAVRSLRRRWEREFAKVASQWGPSFARSAKEHIDASFSREMQKAGFTVRWRKTPAVNDILQASITENVNLIKSIASQHLTQVEGIVMRSVQEGRDLGTLSKDLQQQFGVAKRRAALIARDQNNKVTSAINRARQDELGITEGIWLHSHGGKVPRPTHVKMDGQRYSIKKGMWDPDEKKWIWPGQLISCRCVGRSVIPGLG